MLEPNLEPVIATLVHSHPSQLTFLLDSTLLFEPDLLEPVRDDNIVIFHGFRLIDFLVRLVVKL